MRFCHSRFPYGSLHDAAWHLPDNHLWNQAVPFATKKWVAILTHKAIQKRKKFAFTYLKYLVKYLTKYLDNFCNARYFS